MLSWLANKHKRENCLNTLSPLQKILSIAVLISIVFVVFIQVKNAGFQNYDDFEYLENDIVLDGFSKNNLQKMLTTPVNSNWHPVTILSLAVDYKIYGLTPAGFHLTNLLIHALTTVFVFLVMYLILQQYWQSFFVAVLFAVLPLNVEPVAWVAERKGLLAGLGFILTLYLYLQYNRSGKIKYYYFSITFFVLGLLAKASIVFTPVLLVLVDIYFKSQQGDFKPGNLASILKKNSIYFFISIVFTFITVYIHSKTGALESAAVIGFVDRLINMIVSYVTYIRQFFIPFDLSVFYVYRVDHGVIKIFGFLFFLAGLTFLFYRARRNQPYLLLGWLWFIFAMLPTSGIIQTGIHAHADRYMYIPSLGLIIILVMFFSDISKRFKHGENVFLVIMFGVSMAFASISYIQAGYWESPKTLFEKLLKHDKKNQLANWHLSTYYLKKGNVSQGMKYYTKVTEQEHKVFGLYQKTARLLITIPDYKHAEHVLKDGILAFPNADVHYRLLGRLYAVQNRFKKATPLLHKAIKLNPYNPANLRVLIERYSFAEDYLTAKKYCDVLTSKYSYYQYGINLCEEINAKISR